MRFRRSVVIVLQAAALIRAQPPRASQFGASISGLLADPAGRPLSNWRVQAGRWQYHNGRKEFDLLPGASVTTGADGGFVISPLDPGEYCIRAENPYAQMRDLAPNLKLPAAEGPDYTKTYYPGVTDIESATAVAAGGGGTISGVDFRVQAAEGFHVRGKLTGTPGMMLWMKTEPVLVPEDGRRIAPKPDGSFDLDRVLPGTYTVSGFFQESTAYAAITVKDRDVDNVTIQMLPCPKIRGAIRLDGLSSVTSLTVSALHAAISYGVQVDKDGTFICRCIELGRYSLVVDLGRDRYIKSILLDGKDVTNEPLDFTSRSDKMLDLDLGAQSAVIRGVARDASGNLLPGHTITAWNSESNFSSSAITDKAGAFEISHVPPGTYRVAGWDKLHSQPQGWGVQTVREFRGAFNGTASLIVVNRGEQALVDPVAIPSRSILEAARKLNLNAVMMPDEQEAAIREAAKSPYTLAKLIEANPHLDENTLAKVLGLDEHDFSLPCNFVVSNCKVHAETVVNPDMALVVIQNAIPGRDVYLRYAQKPGSLWQFAGAAGASAHYGEPTHETVRMWGKPFLKTVADWSQVGAGIVDRVEEWFDLTNTQFTPVFSFTAEGGTNGFSMAVSTASTSEVRIGTSGSSEQIELTVRMHFSEPGMDVERVFIGIYQRPAAGKFKLVSAYSDQQHSHTISAEEFEALANPMEDTAVNLLSYALPGLRKIASGSDAEAREWLESVLEHSEDSAEKRELAQLLKRR